MEGESMGNLTSHAQAEAFRGASVTGSIYSSYSDCKRDRISGNLASFANHVFLLSCMALDVLNALGSRP